MLWTIETFELSVDVTHPIVAIRILFFFNKI
jgi:hypothetical protein